MRKTGIDGKPLSPALFEEQYRRIFEITECRTQSELAKVLGVRQASISDAKRRKSIPVEWRMTLFIKKRINPEWILSGEGSKYIIPPCAKRGKPQVAAPVIRPLRQCSTQELVNELLRRALKEPAMAEVWREIAEQWKSLETSGNVGDRDTGRLG